MRAGRQTNRRSGRAGTHPERRAVAAAVEAEPARGVCAGCQRLGVCCAQSDAAVGQIARAQGHSFKHLNRRRGGGAGRRGGCGAGRRRSGGGRRSVSRRWRGGSGRRGRGGGWQATCGGRDGIQGGCRDEELHQTGRNTTFPLNASLTFWDELGHNPSRLSPTTCGENLPRTDGQTGRG